MKIAIVGFLTVLCIGAVRQVAEHSELKLKVENIRELHDCYIFTAVNTQSLDTLYLASIKGNLSQSNKYKEISTCKEYLFVVKNRSKSLSVPDDNFRLRIRNTVVWKGSDDLKRYPLMLENTTGLYILKENKITTRENFIQ